MSSSEKGARCTTIVAVKRPLVKVVHAMTRIVIRRRAVFRRHFLLWCKIGINGTVWWMGLHEVVCGVFTCIEYLLLMFEPSVFCIGLSPDVNGPGPRVSERKCFQTQQPDQVLVATFSLLFFSVTTRVVDTSISLKFTRCCDSVLMSLFDSMIDFNSKCL